MIRNSKGQFIKGSKGHLGYKHSKESKEKMSKARKGYKLTEEWKRKISSALKGIKKHPITQETREKMRLNNLGKKMSAETRMKMSISKRGAASYLWRGGISKKNRTERQNIMSTFEYKLWRETIFKRDNWVCQICNKRGNGELNADHIKPFVLYPELRFELSNGRTLCRNCHLKFGWKSSHIKIQKVSFGGSLIDDPNLKAVIT